ELVLGRRAFTARAPDAGAAIDLRQHLRARLHRAFAGEQPAGFGGGELRVAGAGQFVGLQQVFRGGGGRQQDEGEGENEAAANHAVSLGFSSRTRRRAGGPRRRDRGGR